MPDCQDCGKSSETETLSALLSSPPLRLHKIGADALSSGRLDLKARTSGRLDRPDYLQNGEAVLSPGRGQD